MAEAPERDPEHLRIHRVIARAARQRDSHAALQEIAEGVTEVVGFGLAAISYLRDPETYETLVVSGNDEARAALEGTTVPRRDLDRELSQGDEWGLLRFVPQGRIPDGETMIGWVPDFVPVDEPDAWLPKDFLCAPLIDETGEMVGMLSVDLPHDGRRPGRHKRRLLEHYAVQAGRAVVDAMARGQLTEEVRLSTAARTIVSSASAELSINRILEASQGAIAEGFRATGIWLQTFDEDGLGRGAIYNSDGADGRLPDELLRLAPQAARYCWREQRVAILAEEIMPGQFITEEQHAVAVTFLHSVGLASFMFVPLGAGPECLGYLVLSRTDAGAEWSELEESAALDIGHDLGRALLNARLFERERHLVSELTEVDAYKSRLIATISHELKNPLTAVLGHAELLESTTDGLGAGAQSSVDAITRNAGRLSRIVDDLLTLSEAGAPADADVPVDLRKLVEDALDLLGLQVARKNLAVKVLAREDSVLALGDPVNLARMCTNLVSNAVKYTPPNRGVWIELSRTGDEVVLSVADEGLGISPKDQEQLFGEFFRSTNPVAVALPGTGLGLAIVRRVVDQHGGRIDVRSELAKGSTFEVTLPAAPRDAHPAS